MILVYQLEYVSLSRSFTGWSNHFQICTRQ